MTQQQDNTSPDLQRRRLLSTSAGLAALSLAPGVLLYRLPQAQGKVDPAVRWGMLIDANRCPSDCDHCVAACNQENGLTPIHGRQTDAQWIRKVNLKDKTTGRQLSLPMMCQHCANPPCVDVCPTGASFKRADGVVLVDKHICIGCRYCMMACPYKARSFIHEDLDNQKAYAPRGKGTVESCTLCVHRIDEGGVPACVERCQERGQGAILFGDLNDPNSAIAQALREYPSTAVRADLGLEPGVRYRGL